MLFWERGNYLLSSFQLITNFIQIYMACISDQLKIRDSMIGSCTIYQIFHLDVTLSNHESLWSKKSNNLCFRINNLLLDWKLSDFWKWKYLQVNLKSENWQMYSFVYFSCRYALTWLHLCTYISMRVYVLTLELR